MSEQEKTVKEIVADMRRDLLADGILPKIDQRLGLIRGDALGAINALNTIKRALNTIAVLLLFLIVLIWSKLP